MLGASMDLRNPRIALPKIAWFARRSIPRIIQVSGLGLYRSTSQAGVALASLYKARARIAQSRK